MLYGLVANGETYRLSEKKMTEQEFRDWRRYGDSYFGVQSWSSGELDDLFSAFEWLVEGYEQAQRFVVENLLGEYRDVKEMKRMSNHDLVLELCEIYAFLMQEKNSND